MKRILCIFCFLSFTASAQLLFSTHDQQHAEKALGALAMTPDDVKFKKDHGEPDWALSWVTNALNDPFMLPEVADRIYQASEEYNDDSIWSLAADLLEVEVKSVQDEYPEPMDQLTDELDEIVKTALVEYYYQSSFALLLMKRAFQKLGLKEQEYLAASVISGTFNTELNAESRRVSEASGISRDVQKRVEAESDLLDGTDTAIEWLNQLNQIDLMVIQIAGNSLEKAASKLYDDVVAVTNWPDKTIVADWPFGTIAIGTTGDDVFEGYSTLILDPGGNDEYRNGAGSANGLMGHWASAIIDLGGNDRYLSDDLLAPGSALFGVSVLLDEAGNDLYESDYVGTAAAIYGAAWVEDFDGHDIYRAQAICQGAGITGFGTLIDHSGNDHYQAGLYGQGFAGVKGWGMLLDRKGNDVYVAGNVRRDSDRNEDRYLSLSQGFSIGARPHAGGGVASLIDLEGNDTYTADVYGQGVSYYYSAGFLIDKAGNDRYSMYQYGQGCGIHFSLGLLADCAGNDMYSGFILAQGAAHDYSVGMLFDHAGNDTYTADHHAQGRALNNAFALLVDREGNDGYFGRQRDGTQGIGNDGGFRDYGSLALLLDLNGHDVYSGGFSNRMITLRPLYGVVYDFEEEDGHE